MTERCVFCGAEDHDSGSCPMFGTTDSYLKAFAPRADASPEEPVRSSLPSTQFEQVFGPGAEPLLGEVMDDDRFSPEQRQLAMEIAGGVRNLHELTPEDHAHLDDITLQMMTQPAKKDPPPPPPRKSPYISTRAEMENFENEYMPPVEKRDWPLSPFDPEGFQG